MPHVNAMTESEWVALCNEFEAFKDRCKEQGVNLVGVMSHYTQDSAQFCSAFSVTEYVPNPKMPTIDHVMGDSITRIMSDWHNAMHMSQLEFVPGTEPVEA